MKVLKITFVFALFFATNCATAQSLLNGFMNGKGKGTFALSYSGESYDNVFLAPTDAKGVPVFNDVTVKSTSFFGTYGLTDKLDITASLPYITVNGNASQDVLNELQFQNERKGLQDLSLFAKYRVFESEMSQSKLQIMAGAGIKTPLGGYNVAEGLQSILAIGNRATSFNGLAIAHFKTNGGFFATGQLGYSFRSSDVPNAFLSELKLGYAASKFYVDGWLATQSSNGGVNILGDGFKGIFPATDVSYSRAGITVFAPIAKGFGVSASASQYLSGRNIGQSTGFSGAITYSF